MDKKIKGYIQGYVLGLETKISGDIAKLKERMGECESRRKGVDTSWVYKGREELGNVQSEFDDALRARKRECEVDERLGKLEKMVDELVNDAVKSIEKQKEIEILKIKVRRAYGENKE